MRFARAWRHARLTRNQFRTAVEWYTDVVARRSTTSHQGTSNSTCQNFDFSFILHSGPSDIKSKASSENPHRIRKFTNNRSYTIGIRRGRTHGPLASYAAMIFLIQEASRINTRDGSCHTFLFLKRSKVRQINSAILIVPDGPLSCYTLYTHSCSGTVPMACNLRCLM